MRKSSIILMVRLMPGGKKACPLYLAALIAEFRIIVLNHFVTGNKCPVNIMLLLTP